MVLPDSAAQMALQPSSPSLFSLLSHEQMQLRADAREAAAPHAQLMDVSFNCSGETGCIVGWVLIP